MVFESGIYAWRMLDGGRIIERENINVSDIEEFGIYVKRKYRKKDGQFSKFILDGYVKRKNGEIWHANEKCIRELARELRGRVKSSHTTYVEYKDGYKERKATEWEYKIMR